jgi:hypothetical protein
MRIAVIGNGKSLLTLKKGREIDGHDLVVRMNCYYRFKDQEITGLKTDIWSCCFDSCEAEPFSEKAIEGVKEIWVARPAEWDNGNPYWKICPWAKPALKNGITHDEYNVSGRLVGGNPTTGFLTLVLANRVYPEVTKDLYGYDFFEPKGWYYEGSDIDFPVFHHHNPKGEKKVVEQWHKEGKVNLIRE